MADEGKCALGGKYSIVFGVLGSPSGCNCLKLEDVAFSDSLCLMHYLYRLLLLFVLFSDEPKLIRIIRKFKMCRRLEEFTFQSSCVI